MSVRLETLSELFPTGERAPDDSPEAKAEAATGLEAMFLRFMMAELRKGSSGGLLDGGYAGQTFRQLFDEQIADTMAQAGGIGLADALERQFSLKSPTPPAESSKDPATDPHPASHVRRAYGVQMTVTPNHSNDHGNDEKAAQVPEKAVESMGENGGR